MTFLLSVWIGVVSSVSDYTYHFKYASSCCGVMPELFTLICCLLGFPCALQYTHFNEVIWIPLLLFKLWILYGVESCLLVVFWPVLAFCQHSFIKHVCKIIDIMRFVKCCHKHYYWNSKIITKNASRVNILIERFFLACCSIEIICKLQMISECLKKKKERSARWVKLI